MQLAQTAQVVQTSSSLRAPVYDRCGKRLLDVCLVALFAPFWVPVTLIFAFFARLQTGRAFSVNVRVGRGGQEFVCWKISTMLPLAHRDCAAEKSPVDPQLTRLGRFLRASRLDGLPRLWCVLNGDMSLVGPRPVPERELARYGKMRNKYLEMKPGLTGLWQVSGRNKLSYGERICLDAKYARTVSFRLDAMLLLITLIEFTRLGGR